MPREQKEFGLGVTIPVNLRGSPLAAHNKCSHVPLTGDEACGMYNNVYI